MSDKKQHPAFGKRDAAQDSARAKAAVDSGEITVASTESYPGAACTTSDGRSGFMVASGNRLVCVPDDGVT